MLDLSGQNVGDGFNAPMRMPGESSLVVARLIVSEIIEKQDRVELRGVVESEPSVEMNSGPFDSGTCLHDSFDGSQ